MRCVDRSRGSRRSAGRLRISRWRPQPWIPPRFNQPRNPVMADCAAAADWPILAENGFNGRHGATRSGTRASPYSCGSGQGRGRAWASTISPGGSMPVDPQIQALLDKGTGVPATHTLSIAEARAQYEARIRIMAPPASVGSVSERTIQGPAGDLKLRIYHPAGQGPFA